jgi:hypothetical protein
LWGTHGDEAIVTGKVTDFFVDKLTQINSLDTYVIGPVSPWSYRNEFRFDRTMSDPNRIITRQSPDNNEYNHLLKEWRASQPKDLEQIQNFLIRIHQIGLDIGQLFNHCQTTDRDFFGYVNVPMQNKRIKFLTKLICRNINRSNPSRITLIDIHAGIGLNAETILFYEGNSSIPRSKFLIDAIGSNIYQSFGIQVRTVILETGVVNNQFCLINVLSEIASRTYGFDQPIPRISQVVNDEWIFKAKKKLNIKILGDI